MRCLMFDTVLNRIIVFLSVLVLILGLFIAGLFVPPVFADSYDVPAFSSRPTTAEMISSFVLAEGRFNGTGNLEYFAAGTDSSNTLRVGFISSSNQFCFASPVSATPVYWNYTSNTSSTSTGVSSSTTTFNSTYNLYYTLWGVPSSYIPLSTLYIDSYDSIDSFLADFDNVHTDTFESLYDGFNLPRGYLARITFRDSSVSDNNSITLTSTFGNKSNAITGRFNSSQWYRFINTDLASIVLQYESLGTKISWTPFGNHTTLGQYENGSFSITGSSSTQLWLVNPVYQSYQINSLGVALAGHGLNGVLNNNVVINDPNGIIEQIRIFPLSSGLVAGVDGVVNETNEDAYKDVNGSTSGAFTYTDSNGNITGSVPQNGATLVDDTTATSLDILNTIKNAFNDLINRLESIFHPAQGFFNTILGSFNDFVHWLSQLWSWLPSPIVSLIEAVLYISILVGCIKLVF